jgi:hypothetical protein
MRGYILIAIPMTKAIRPRTKVDRIPKGMSWKRTAVKKRKAIAREFLEIPLTSRRSERNPMKGGPNKRPARYSVLRMPAAITACGTVIPLLMYMSAA